MSEQYCDNCGEYIDPVDDCATVIRNDYGMPVLICFQCDAPPEEEEDADFK